MISGVSCGQTGPSREIAPALADFSSEGTSVELDSASAPLFSVQRGRHAWSIPLLT